MTLDDGARCTRTARPTTSTPAAQRGEPMDYLARARVRADTGWAIRQGARGDRRPDLAPTAPRASPTSSPMQRLWRDANTAGRHAS